MTTDTMLISLKLQRKLLAMRKYRWQLNAGLRSQVFDGVQLNFWRWSSQTMLVLATP